MKLVIGGFAQGKLNTVIKTIPGNSYLVFDGKLPNDAQLQNKKEETLVIINHHAYPCRPVAVNSAPTLAVAPPISPALHSTSMV